MFILQWNTGGLISHLSEFKQHLRKSAPLVAALQETHFRDNDIYNFTVPGYSLYQNNVISDHRQGGVALYISNSILHHEVKLATTLNAVAVQVNIFHCEILIVSLYLPPNSPFVTASKIENLLNQMPNNCLILGDFNAHSPLWGSQRLSQRGSQVEALLNKHALVCMNDGSPTFMSFSYRSTSAIDLSIASPRLAPKFKWTVTSDPLFSDHFPIHLLLTCNTPKLPPTSTKRWCTKYADWAAFNASVTCLAG